MSKRNHHLLIADMLEAAEKILEYTRIEAYKPSFS
jgi:uncharacterized protein with HEPN domain